MRRKIWTENDLHLVSATAAGGKSTSGTRAIGGGEATDLAGPASRMVPAPPDATAGGEGLESDIRLKDDIVRIGQHQSRPAALPLPLQGPPGTYSGVMAQDVLGVMPRL